MIPVADSRTAEMDDTEQNISFDISDRDVQELVPLQEQSAQGALTETILEDRGTTYTVLESGSRKRSKVLVSSLGYAYGVKRENKGSTIWRCTSRSRAVRCPVMVRQVGGTFMQIHEHLHASVPDRQLRMQVYSKVRDTARNEVFRPAMTIAEDAMLEHRGPDDVAPPKKSLLKRTANRARAKLRPDEPKTLGFEMNDTFIDADAFLVADIAEDGQRHFVFATEYQLFKNAKRWYMDGTFKVVGEPFKRQGQLFSIHAFIERDGKTQQLPLVICLMSRRTKKDYVMVLRALIQRIGHAAVEGFVADYEQAAWLAVREVFPGVEVKGCTFHWSQAVWRHVQNVGLSETYRRRMGVHTFVRMLLALQFLPAAHIRRAFDTIKERATTHATQLLTDYMERQWLTNPLFRVEDWSVFIRTNNDVEGWHHRLNGKAGGCGLGFYRLVPLLRREAELVKMAVESGDLARGRSARNVTKDNAISSCWDKYMDGSMKTSGFLSKLGDIYALRT